MSKETLFWHSSDFREALHAFGVQPQLGLSEEEALRRLKEGGLNKLPEEKPLPGPAIFLKQFQSPLIYILVIAGIITLFFHKFTDSVVIFGAVLLNTIVGYFQERKSTKALTALKKKVKIRSRVIREGREQELDSEYLVPGDIIVISSGDKVSADARLIEVHNLKTNEAPLTGEWLLAEKKTEILPIKTSLADRDNMVYMGTTVEDGRGVGLVVATGKDTEIGKIAVFIKETKAENTPLQKKLASFTRLIGGVIAVLSVLIFLGGINRGIDALTMFETAVAVAVAGIPEGLPVAMTVILALGMQRILRRKGLVRKLVAAETLGSTSVIASDKTLTLTEGRMEVVKTVTIDTEIGPEGAKKWSDVFKEKKVSSHLLLMTAPLLTSQAFAENPDEPFSLWKVRGRPTDKAFLTGGASIGLDKGKLEKEFQKIADLPFDPKHKFTAVLCKKGNDYFLFVVGAPEKILSLSKLVQRKNKMEILQEDSKDKLQGALQKITSEGLRAIGTAYKKIPNTNSGALGLKLEDQIKDLVFIGFMGLRDPLRPDAAKAISLCRSAGMRPIIITGDHLLTAKAVARELGLESEDKNCMTGEELDSLSDEQFQERIADVEIYARAEPRHKLKIVEAWQRRGEVIAMTGDGVNDAPALRRADIGVALGSGTDVAKEIADLVLLDDNFNIIVAAVEEGRVIIDNIRKVITYLLSTTFTEIILIGTSILFGFPLPVTAVQILWVNLIIDGLPGVALAFESKEKEIMLRSPQGHRVPLLTRQMKTLIFIIGIMTDLFLLLLFLWLLGKYGEGQIDYIRTMVFVGLAMGSLFFMFSCKSLRNNIWNINIFSNTLLSAGWIVGVLMIAGAVYIPLFQILLHTVPLKFQDWTILLGIGLANLFLIEMTKYYFISKKEDL